MNASRHIKLSILHFAKATGLFALSRMITRRAVRILCYHGIWTMADGFPGDAMFMSPETFRNRLSTIKRLGYPVIPLDHAVEAVAGRRTLPEASIAITIDDGWASTYTHMLPELEREKIPATLYCDTAHLRASHPVPHVMARYLHKLAGSPALDIEGIRAIEIAGDKARNFADRIEGCRSLAATLGMSIDPYLRRQVFHYMSEQELRRAARIGLDIQLHTHNHTMHDQRPSEIAAEIDANREALATILDRPAGSFTHFCYPSGVCSIAAARSVGQCGTDSATTTRQGLTWPGMDLHLLPRLLDGEQISSIEFEAELSGFADLLRFARRCADTVLSTLPNRDRTKIDASSWNHA